MEGSIMEAGRYIGAGMAMLGAAGAGIGVGLSALGALTGMARNPDVITSYSIHYMKLYERQLSPSGRRTRG